MRCSTVLQTIPFISLSQKHRAASKNCKCSQFWSRRGRGISWCNTEKSARHQAAPKASPHTLPGRRLDWGVNCVPGRNKSALHETWAMLQHCKILKRQSYIYIGWRNTNCLEDFCSLQNNRKFGGQSGIFKPASHSVVPKLSVQPRKNTKIFRSILHLWAKIILARLPSKITAFYFSFSTSVIQSVNNET